MLVLQRKKSLNPWLIGDGWNEKILAAGSFDFEYEEGMSENDPLLNNIFIGGYHNIIQLTLPAELQGFNYVHFAEQCGNDNMMGANPVPEPPASREYGTWGYLIELVFIVLWLGDSAINLSTLQYDSRKIIDLNTSICKFSGMAKKERTHYNTTLDVDLLKRLFYPLN